MSTLEEPAWLWELLQPSSSDRPRLPLGARIAKQYVIESVLGAGGFGTVYRAKDERLQRAVAIKVLHPDVGGGPRGDVPALEEARAAAKVPAPGIVVVHDVSWIDALDGVTDPELRRWLGAPYIVTELLEGASLRTVLERGPLPPVEALRIAAKIAGTLAQAHDGGVAHGDLKPENVWLVRNGQVKLLDFGLARAIAARGGATRPRGGTPGYMAPQGPDAPNAAAGDVYSLGVLAHELVHGSREGPPAPDERVVPLALDELLTACRALDPHRRPTARQAAFTFERVLAVLVGPSLAPGWGSPGPCPYPGLGAFDEDQARYYFGRAPDVHACLEAWGADRPWLSIEGASGSGKSSLVQAGLLPALRRRLGALRVIRVAPAVASLERVRGELAAAPTSPDEVRVVVIDALEALFASDIDLLAADAALEGLFELSPPIRLLTTLRADCAGRLGALPKASARLNASATRYVLGPLTSSGLREAIHGPAALAGRRVDPDLVTRLILDASRSDGSLPLLAHVLRSMWERHDGDQLTLEDYDAIGHLGGALSEGADRVLERLPLGGRAATRRLLLSLCTIDESGRALRRPSTIEHAIASTGLGADRGRALVDRLSTGSEDGLRILRIISAGGDASDPAPASGAAGAQVELVHEALIDAWDALAGWVREEALALRARYDLESSAAAWQAAGAPEDGVARGAQLTYFEGAGRVDGVAARFLATSRAARERARRDRYRRRSVAVVALATLGVTLSALLGWGLHERAEGERRRQQGLDAVQRLAGAIDTQLTALPGTVEARAQLIETAEYLVPDVDQRPDTLSSRGALLYQRGRLARGRGEHERALRDLQAAAAAQRLVVERVPSLQAELSLARTLEMLHWQHLTMRDHEAALNAALEMGARLEGARAAGNDDTRLAVYHARAFKLMARVYELEVGSEAALDHYRRSLSLLEHLDGSEAEAARINVWACIGNMELIQGEYEAARRSYGDALQSSLSSSGARPGSLEARRDLLWLWLGLGRIELEAGRPVAAQDNLRQALRLGRLNIEAEPGLDAVYGIDLATVLHELAHAEVETGSFADAEVHAQEAERIAIGLAATEPLRHGIILARARNAQARLALARGRFEETLAHIDAALHAFEAASGRRAGNQHTVIIHARLLMTRVEALEALGRSEAARATRERVAGIVGPVVDRDPLDHQAADALWRAAVGEVKEGTPVTGRPVMLEGSPAAWPVSRRRDARPSRGR